MLRCASIWIALCALGCGSAPPPTAPSPTAPQLAVRGPSSPRAHDQGLRLCECEVTCPATGAVFDGTSTVSASLACSAARSACRTGGCTTGCTLVASSCE